jgi:hypothetical protein
MYQMRHYVQHSGGLVHVTNWVGPYCGQHHVHTEAEFMVWKLSEGVGVLDLKTLAKCKPCDCGLAAGEMK